MFQKIYNFFDKIEDRVRGRLSHFPIIYAFLGGIGIVLFWRGVWLSADYLISLLDHRVASESTINITVGTWWDGPLSFAVGSVFLLMSGIFVSNFIGNEIIITGLKGEKKVAEKTKKELDEEEHEITTVEGELLDIKKELDKIEQEVNRVLKTPR